MAGPRERGAFLSVVEALCVACHVTRIDLVDGTVCDGAGFDVHTHLRRRFGIDDATAVYQSARSRTANSTDDFLSRMERLAETLFTRADGVPALRSGEVAERLARAVDPHVVSVFHPTVRPGPREHYVWPLQTSTDAWEAKQLLRDASHELHVHLAGALDPAVLWMLLMSGRVAFQHLVSMPTGDLAPGAGRRWVTAVSEAAWNRLRCLKCLIPSEELDALDQSFFTRDEFDELLGLERETAPAPQYVVALARTAQRGRANKASPWWCVPTLREVREEGVSVGALLAADRMQLHRVLEHLRALPAGHQDAMPLGQALAAHVAVRNAFHQALTLECGTAGLYRFSELNRRRRFLRVKRPFAEDASRRRKLRETVALERFRVTAAAEALTHDAFPDDRFAGRQSPARHVEFRVNLTAGTEMRHIVRAWLAGLGDHFEAVRRRTGAVPHHQFGFVVHFSKSSSREKVRHDAIQSARALAGLLKETPQLRRVFVGIDAAGRERDARPRDFLAAYHYLRAFAANVYPRGGEPPVRLGWTFHAGEDPWDVLSGLRQMDEAATLLLGRALPRLGHGLALMRDPATAIYGSAPTHVPVGDHLLDLVWAWGRFREQRLPAEVARIEQRVAAVFAEHTQGKDDIKACWEAMGLGDGAGVARRAKLPEERDPHEFFDGTSRVAGSSEADLLHTLGFRGDDQALVPVLRHPEWLAIVREAQEIALRNLRARRVCIEACPTGNVIIGGFAGFESLPYTRATASNIPLAICTDNPGLFRTSLLDEFDRMHRSLRRTLPPDQVYAWLRARMDEARAWTFLGPTVPMGRDAWRSFSSKRIDAMMFRAALPSSFTTT